MSRLKFSWPLFLTLSLIFSAESVLALTVTHQVHFDSATQQFYVHLHLRDCQYKDVKRGNLTQYVTITGVDRYMANRPSEYGNAVVVRGSFKASSTYQIKVDGRICDRVGEYSGTVSTGKYPAAVEFLSKGLYFSKINPHLRFRHREISSIQWQIYRISKENRYLLSRTESIKLKAMQTTGELDTTLKDAQTGYYGYVEDDEGTDEHPRYYESFRYLEDYPGKFFEVSSTVERSADWKVDSLDLTPYYKEGDWLVIVAGMPTAKKKIIRLANKVIQFTNLGLHVRKHERGVWGHTLVLDTGTPVFAKLALKQRNGEVLHETDTDINGWFQLEWSALANSSMAKSLHRIEAVRGEDSVEVFLFEGPIPIGSFPVSGEDQRLPMQAFVYSDRGLYRLGDTVHLTTLMRHWDLRVPQIDMTSELAIEGPTGRVHRVMLPQADFQNGGATWSWSIPQHARTGRYRAEIRNVGKLIGVGTFAVEQVIPPSIEGEVKLRQPHATWDVAQSQITPVTGNITLRFLFGAPASGKTWEYHCGLEPGKLSPEQYKDFVFEDSLKAFPAMTFFQQQGLSLDSDGKGVLECRQSESLSAEMVLEKLPGIGQVKVVANVFEEGGRSIHISQSVPGYFHAVYPGIRPMFEGHLDYGKPASFQIVAVEPQTAQPRAGVKLTVDLFERDYRGWYYFHGWNEPVVDSELTRVLRSTEEIITQGDPVSYSVTPPGCCDWELRVSVADSGVSARVAFRNGWWRGPGVVSELSHRVTMVPDKDSYKVGETAHIIVDAPFDGELLLFHEKDGQSIVTDRVSVVDRKAEYRLTLTKEHSPWFHVNALLLRTVHPSRAGFKAKRETPYRALGMVPIQVHAPDEFLTLTLQAPAQVMPHSEFPLTITALDAQGRHLSGEVWMTVAVVDEGLLNLAKFSTPDPYANLHKRPAYPNEWYDTFGQVIPYSLHKGDSAFGGDEGPLVSTRVQRVIPMAWWSGIVNTNANGELTLTVPVHDYTGRVRVMVVGWQDKRTGTAEAKVAVFAPVDLFTSLPRVFGAFDQSQAVAEVFNNTATAQNITVSLSTTGALKPSDGHEAVTIIVPGKQSNVVSWNLQGIGSPGKATVTFFAKNQDGDTRTRSTDLFVRPLGIPLEFVESFLLKGGESYQVMIPDDLDFAPGTGEWEVTLSASPAVKIAKHLQYLVGYPHGCIEQTTSRLFAMLMLKSTLGADVLARSLGTEKAGAIDQFIDEGMQKLASMQMPDGGFAFWPGASSQYTWLNAYVAHFLWKARQLSYQIPDPLYDGALQRLKEQFAGSRSPYVSAEYSNDVVAYSAFVLALHGQLSRSDLQWLVSRLRREAIKRDNIKLAVAHAMTLAAMTQAGQAGRGLAVLSGLPEATLDSPAEWWRFGHSFLSREAAFAAKLYTQALAGDKSVVPAVLLLLDKLAEQRYASTHTIAWALLAVDQIFSAQDGVTRATVATPRDTTHDITSEVGRNQISGTLAAGENRLFSINNQSPERNVYGYFTYRGWPLQPPKTGFEQHIELTRLYMNEEGKLLIPPFAVEQGQRLFVVLMARHLIEGLDSLSNVAVEDWLPAGFEIENPRLLGEDALPELPREFMNIDVWKTDHVDYLDDKISGFGTFTRDRRAFVFSVRAVSQGTFQLMPSTAEAMYIPEFRALTVIDNQVTVTSRK